MEAQVPLLTRMAVAGLCTMEQAAAAGNEESHPLHGKILAHVQSHNDSGAENDHRFTPILVDRPSLRMLWEALVRPLLGGSWDPSKAHDAAWDTMRTAEVYEAMLESRYLTP